MELRNLRSCLAVVEHEDEALLPGAGRVLATVEEARATVENSSARTRLV